MPFTPSLVHDLFWPGLQLALGISIPVGIILGASIRWNLVWATPLCFLVAWLLTVAALLRLETTSITIAGLLEVIIAFALIGVASRLMSMAKKQPSPHVHGTAHWGIAEETTTEGFLLGKQSYSIKKDPVSIYYDGHVITCAPTGAGKGIGAVVPNLLQYPGSSVVIDIKGENYAVTAAQRKNLDHTVILFDPFAVVTNAPTQCYNWLGALNPEDECLVRQSKALADSMILNEQGADHWNDSASGLLQGIIVYVKCSQSISPEDKHMGEVYRLLTQAPAAFNKTLTAMSKDTKLGYGIPSVKANGFLAKESKERAGVLSTLLRHIDFLGDPQIVRNLSKTDEDITKFKKHRMSIYLVLPPGQLASYNRYLRGILGILLNTITEDASPPKHKIAFFLDEFAQLGKFEAFEQALPLLRGYGVAFWFFIQDISQLKAVYPKWQGFFGNCAQQYFGTQDIDTAKYISQSMGTYTETINHTSKSRRDGKTSRNYSTQLLQRNLMNPDEILRLKREQLILFLPNQEPFLADRLNYRNDAAYAGLFKDNPYHASRASHDEASV